jgi:lactoylglutathione lyase
MTPVAVVDRLFEAHLIVADLDVSIAFYRDRLGFELAYVTPEHHAAFFWIGSRGRSMLGLWHAGAAPQKTTAHVAFAAAPDAVIAAPQRLQSAGIVALDFNGQPTDEPVVLAWMPALAVYFLDPDGHLLEYIAMLEGEPRPGEGVVALSAWSSHRRASAQAMRSELQTVDPLPAMKAGLVACRTDAECEALGTFLADRIYEFNVKATGYDDGMLLAGCVRNDAGDIIAGFNGHTWGACCELSHVWVDERYRGQGLGAALLRSAEAEAFARGCSQVVLATHSFQAPGFYERMGYDRKYAIEGRPKGYSDVIYVKVLRAAVSALT